MGAVSATNLKTALVAIDAGAYTSMSVTEETTPQVVVKTETEVESNTAPDKASIENAVNSATGGIAVVSSVVTTKQAPSPSPSPTPTPQITTLAPTTLVPTTE